MKLSSRIHSIIKSEIYLLMESKKTDKLLIDFPGKITQDVINKMEEINKNGKYLEWLCRMYIQKPFDIEVMREPISLFTTLVDRGRLPGANINNYKTKEDFIEYVKKANEKKSLSIEDLKSEYTEIKIPVNTFRIFMPFSWEAAQALGNTYFTIPGESRCLWCVTWAIDDHYKGYVNKADAALVFFKIESEELKKELEMKINSQDYNFSGVCAAFTSDGKLEELACLKDLHINEKEAEIFFEIINMDPIIYVDNKHIPTNRREYKENINYLERKNKMKLIEKEIKIKKIIRTLVKEELVKDHKKELYRKYNIDKYKNDPIKYNQLKIALDTLSMPTAMVRVMDGLSSEKAKQIVKKITGKDYEDLQENSDNTPQKHRMKIKLPFYPQHTFHKIQ